MTTADVTAAYHDRFRRVLAYIDSHPDGDLSLAQLCSLAAFSKFHFQRQFAALFGIGVYQYVQLIRLRRASYQLAFRHQQRVIDIALAGGYDTPESFARAFKKRSGQTPSEFREQPQWAPWHAPYRQLSELRTRHMQPSHQAEHVKIVHFPETQVAVYEHRGDPELIGASIRRFIEWRREAGLPPRISATFNIAYDHPEETPPSDYRFDLCAATDRPVAPNPQGVVAKTIPGGRCALLRHVGSDDTLAATVRFLYAEWLPRSAEDVRDFPIFFQRVSFFPDVPEHQAITDVFLPLK